jgi:adenine phosphoribosyltransferase
MHGEEETVMSAEAVRNAIRDIPDFPKPGIVFKDITPVLGDPALFRACIDLFVDRIAGKGITKLAAIDARGFLFAGAVADRMDLGLVPIRKKGKLPYKTFERTYELEYGSATLAIHQDAFRKGERIALIDDLLATGGTAAASAHLIEQAGGEVAQILFLVELTFLNGRDQLGGYEVFAPVAY